MNREESREFLVQVKAWEERHELPGDWPPSALRHLLEQLEIEGVSDDELLDMALMGLQDRGREEASDIVLQAVFGDTMRPGVRQNLIDDLQDDRPWEDFADLRHQRGIFTAIALLQKAFPKDFGKPDLARIEVSITPKTPTGLRWLVEETNPALLLRLLVAGMDDRAVLRRLFGEALKADRFPEAASIVWRVERTSAPEVSPVELVLFSSIQWLAPLEDADSWTVKAWRDDPVED